MCLVQRQDQPSGLKVAPLEKVGTGERAGRRGRKDCLEVAPVFEVSRTEEAHAKLPVRKAHLSERLGDGRFARSCKTIQPEDVLIPFVH